MGSEQVGILGVEGLREEFGVLPEDLEVFLGKTRLESVPFWQELGQRLTMSETGSPTRSFCCWPALACVWTQLW